MGLAQLPDELISLLLLYVPPEDNLKCFQLLSWRLNALANEKLLWRKHCVDSFSFWSPWHDFPRQLELPAQEVQWKELFLHRLGANRVAARLLDSSIASSQERPNNVGAIAAMGYDVKEFLLRQRQVDKSSHDGLARRQFSAMALAGIHRQKALQEWQRLVASTEDSYVHNTPKGTLERALGAFDLFFIHDGSGDLDDITRMLDELADGFRATFPKFTDLTTRQKALALNRWLRARKLTGLRHQRDYRNLRNLLIGQALRHEDHDSIPLISCAIFCCIAVRLGLNAECCTIPSHVHAMVFSKPGLTLDDHQPATPNDQLERMYLDPHANDEEIPEKDLRAFLAIIGGDIDIEQTLSPAAIRNLVLRAMENMRVTASEGRKYDDYRRGTLLAGSNAENMHIAAYATGWSAQMMYGAELAIPFWYDFRHEFGEDAWLVEKYALPPYVERYNRRPRLGPTSDGLQLSHLLKMDMQKGQYSPTPSPREQGDEIVEYMVGQVFRHKRYGWFGVIKGWIHHGKVQSGNGSSASVGTHSLFELITPIRPGSPWEKKRRDEPCVFYLCLRDGDIKEAKIDAENIEIVTDPDLVDESMFPSAGKYFLRFDRQTCTFVSNMKKEYPDD